MRNVEKASSFPTFEGLIWVDCATSLEKIMEKEKELHICNGEAWNQDKDSPHLNGCKLH